MPFRVVPISIRSRPPARSTTSRSCRSISAGLAKPRANFAKPSRSKRRRWARAIRWSPSRCRIWPRCFKSQCRYDEAESLAKRVIAIREKTLGPRHPDVASTLVNLGNVLWSTSAMRMAIRSTSARLRYRNSRSARIIRRSPSPCTISVTPPKRRSAMPEAEDFDRRAHAIREASLGKDHLDIATTLNGLGNALTAQKKYRRGRGRLRARACDLSSAVSALNHPNAALTAL